MERLKNCRLCPRMCGVDRTEYNKGMCGETAEIRLARAALHFWEEPCISGEKGSGAVFFSGCNLGCIYCQNREISKGNVGKIVSTERLAEIFIELKKKGAQNINLVTPTHFVPQIISAVQNAKMKGLNLPIVYNTSGFETRDTIHLLRNTVDVYLTDYKYFSPELAEKYSHAYTYPEAVKASLDEMVKQQPQLIFGEDNMLRNGVIVRHLMLPGHLQDSKDVISYLYDTYGEKIILSIMKQYTPYKIPENFSELNKKVTDEEYEELLMFALDLGVENAFIQEGEVAEESFIPDFDYEGI